MHCLIIMYCTRNKYKPYTHVSYKYMYILDLIKFGYCCHMQTIRLYASVAFQNIYLNDLEIVEIH